MIYIACRRFFIGEDRFSTILSRSKVSSLIVEFSSNPQGVRYFDPAREDEKRRMIFHYHWLSLLSDNCRHAGCPPLMQPPAPVTALVASGPQFGFGSAPMSACLDVFAATPGVPVTAPWIAGNWRVTCAGTGSCTIALTRVVAAKPSICALQQPGSSRRGDVKRNCPPG